MSAVAPSVARNATPVRFFMAGRDISDVEWAIASSIKHAIGDSGAKVTLHGDDDEGPSVVVVKQSTGTWWTPLPEMLAELIGDLDWRFTLRWREGEPPKAGDDQ